MSFLPIVAQAEPYLAVQTGFKCVQCHANPTGGGLRNEFGNAFAQTQLAAQRLAPEEELWTGRIHRYIALGGNVRGNANYLRIPNQEDSSSFDLEDARVYLEANVIPQRLSIYVDQRLAPGSSQNHEANVRLWLREGSLYVKGGRMYLPFGWRFEDDGTFVRQLSGINMEVPDQGVELGFETGDLSTQLALSNGSDSSSDTNRGKQVVVSSTYVQPAWRFGASALFNDDDLGERKGAALFGGTRVGSLSFLGEVDYIDDDSFGTVAVEQLSALAEVNWLVRQGHNLKLTHEWQEPNRDVDDDDQWRTSLVYEYSPLQFVQLRAGVRTFDGMDGVDIQNRDQVFVQLHGFF